LKSINLTREIDEFRQNDIFLERLIVCPIKSKA